LSRLFGSRIVEPTGAYRESAGNLLSSAGVITLKTRRSSLLDCPLLSPPLLPSEFQMRFSLAAFSFATVALFCVLPAAADDMASLQLRSAARRDLDLARMDLRYYWQVEYPRLKRELDAAIELTQDEIKVYDARDRDLRPFTRFSLGEPFPITIQELRLCRRKAELRLNDLQAERSNLVRFKGDEFRVLELKVMEARLRVAALEADDSIPVHRIDAAAPATLPPK
jgi:hypothetical protein